MMVGEAACLGQCQVLQGWELLLGVKAVRGVVMHFELELLNFGVVGLVEQGKESWYHVEWRFVVYLVES